MNIKSYITAIMSCIYLLFSSCSDNAFNQLGTNILPDEDKITVYLDTFQLAASTIKRDSLYARLNASFLGEFYDPLYGKLKSDFICQFYCKDNFRFAETPDNGKIDAVSLIFEYSDWKGDASSPMQMTVYPVNQKLTKNFYTNVDPTVFCDMQHPLISQAYSAQSGIFDSTYYVWQLVFPLPLEWGQKLYDETIHNPSSFNSQEAFNQFFSGFYITTDYGSGNMLYISNTQIRIDYSRVLKSSTGGDSIVNHFEEFNVSKDVIQLNRLQSKNTEQLLEDNDQYTYLKTPAGIFTRLVFPAVQIHEVIKNRVINNVALHLKYMPKEDWLYSLAPPPYLLLMPEDSIGTFFENRNIENNITTYLSNYAVSSSTTVGYNEAGRVYPFPNIADLLNYHFKNNPDKDLRMLVVPVERVSNTVSSSGTTYTYTSAINHYLAPSGLKIRKDGDNMKIVITSSYLNKK